MISIAAQVNGHELSVFSSSTLASNSVGSDVINFSFDGNWDGYNKTVLFWGADSETPYGSVIDANGNAIIPHEVLTDKGNFRFGVFGEDVENILPRITSTIAKVKVLDGAWAEYIDGDDAVTPTLVEQLRQIVLSEHGNITDLQERMSDAESDIGDLSIAQDATDGVIANMFSWMKNSYVNDTKNLGSELTDTQIAAIKDGSFDGLDLGAYWETEHPTLGAIKWRIWGFDWYYGKMTVNEHHCVIIPDSILVSAVSMNDTATAANGYGGSKMRSTHLASAVSIIEDVFDGYILSVSQYLSNGGDDTHGASSFTEYQNTTVELPSESMLYGCSAHGRGDNTLNNFPILPLALLRPKYVTYKRQSFWLRDVVNASCFAQMSYAGVATYGPANYTDIGIRPYFLLYGGEGE